ncbi:hypothetical protein [Hymenobacter daeguensis]
MVWFSCLARHCLLLAILLGFSACKKEDASPENATRTLLTGRWEFVESSGGFAGKTYAADPARKREIIFTSGGQAIGLLNGPGTATAPYSLHQADAITGTNKTFLTCNGIPGFFANGPIEVSATDFWLSDNVYDGFSHHYVRR